MFFIRFSIRSTLGFCFWPDTKPPTLNPVPKTSNPKPYNLNLQTQTLYCFWAMHWPGSRNLHRRCPRPPGPRRWTDTIFLNLKRYSIIIFLLLDCITHLSYQIFQGLSQGTDLKPWILHPKHSIPRPPNPKPETRSPTSSIFWQIRRFDAPLKYSILLHGTTLF